MASVLLGTPAQDALNEKHRADPQPGDYWQEMMLPILVVCARIGGGVLACEEKIASGTGHMTWNLDKLMWYSLEEFAKKISYGTIPGTWCDVIVGAQMWAAERVAKTLLVK